MVLKKIYVTRDHLNPKWLSSDELDIYGDFSKEWGTYISSLCGANIILSSNSDMIVWAVNK